MESQVADAVATAVQHFGKITGLVTCAGTVGVSSPVEDLDVGAALDPSCSLHPAYFQQSDCTGVPLKHSLPVALA